MPRVCPARACLRVSEYCAARVVCVTLLVVARAVRERKRVEALLSRGTGLRALHDIRKVWERRRVSLGYRGWGAKEEE